MHRKLSVKEKRIVLSALLFLLIAFIAYTVIRGTLPREDAVGEPIRKGVPYSDRESVAEYLYRYRELPVNYITKKEAEALGWSQSEGNLWEVAPGKSIGGDVFGNYEGRLPRKNGRKYFECDIGYEGGRRNAKRIVYSDDGLIYYTEDHYETFELLYDSR